MELSNDEKAQAIQFAMDLEQERFNRYAIKTLVNILDKEEKEKLYNFWKNCSSLTQKAYAECCLYEETKTKRDDFFSMTLKEKIIASIICILLYICLVIVCFALGGYQ